MKEVLGGADVRVPKFAACANVEQSLAFAESCGYPVILKPVDGAASIGVHRVADGTSLASLLPTVDLDRYEVEEFVFGALYHVDGFADENCDVPFQAVSRYVNDCLAFCSGSPLGSVIVQRSDLRDRIEAFAGQCVAELGMRTTPFHLELFVTAADELVFLEIGGRVGGSEVPHLLNKLFGVNLFEVWLRALCGERVAMAPKQGDPSGGWLVVPKPAELPVRVLKATSMRDQVPTVWRELLPREGEVLEPGGAYDALHSGRFILLHEDEETVEANIHRIIENFEFEATSP